MGNRVERRTPRIEVQLPVELSLPGTRPERPTPILGQTLNVGPGGLAVVSDSAVAVGAPVLCRMSIGGDETSFEGTVAWSAPNSELKGQGETGHNLGIEFESGNEPSKQALRNLIAAAQLGKEPVTLRFAGVEQHIRAHASTQPDGIRLTVPLSMLAEGSHVAFDFEHPQMRFQGLVKGTSIDSRGDTPHLRVDIAIPDDLEHRPRKQTQYGWEDELSESRVRNVTLPLGYAIVDPGDLNRTQSDLAADVTPPPVPVPAESRLPQTHGATPDQGAAAPGISANRVPRRRVHTLRWALLCMLPVLAGGLLALIIPAEERPQAGTVAPPVPTPTAPPRPAAPSPGMKNLTQESTRPEQAEHDDVRPQAEADAVADEAEAVSAPQAPIIETAGNVLSLWLPMTGSLEGMRSHVWREPRAIAVQLPDASLDLEPGRYPVDALGVSWLKVGSLGARHAVQVPITRRVRSHEVMRFNGGLEIQIRFDDP